MNTIDPSIKTKTVTEVEFVPRKFTSVEWAEMSHNLSIAEWAELNKHVGGVTKK